MFLSAIIMSEGDRKFVLSFLTNVHNEHVRERTELENKLSKLSADRDSLELELTSVK